MPDVTAAYQEVLRHASTTVSPQSIRPVAEAIVARWQQAAQGQAAQQAAQMELRQALRELRERLTAAAQQAQAAGRIFELRSLEEAVHVLDTADPTGAAPP